MNGRPVFRLHIDFSKDTSIPLAPTGAQTAWGCCIERQLDLRDEESQGQYTRPRGLVGVYAHVDTADQLLTLFPGPNGGPTVIIVLPAGTVVSYE